MIIFQKYLSAEVGCMYTISINQRIKRIKFFDFFDFFKLRHRSFYNPKCRLVCRLVENFLHLKKWKFYDYFQLFD